MKTRATHEKKELNDENEISSSPSFSNEFVIVVECLYVGRGGTERKKVKLTDQRNLEWLNYHVYMNQFNGLDNVALYAQLRPPVIDRWEIFEIKLAIDTGR